MEMSFIAHNQLMNKFVFFIDQPLNLDSNLSVVDDQSVSTFAPIALCMGTGANRFLVCDTVTSETSPSGQNHLRIDVPGSS